MVKSCDVLATLGIAFLMSVSLTGVAHAQTSIMPLGDSITEGYATTATFSQGGYRCPLNSLLTSAKESFTLVGDSEPVLNPGAVIACSEVNWEGHGGYTISGIQGWEDSDGSIANLKPGIILLLGGTNDVAQGVTGSVTSQMTSLLNDIFAKDPNAWVIMSTIPPMYPGASAAASDVAGWAAQVPSANTQLKAVAAKYSRVSMIDFYSAAVGDLPANIGSDGIHPTVTGYGILAGLWEKAILARLGASPAPAPSPSPTSTSAPKPNPSPTTTPTATPTPTGKSVSLTAEDSQGFFWDAGNSSRGTTILQLYEYYKVSTPDQDFVWTPVTGGFTVCSDGICLSDNGEQVIMSSKADVWNITSGSAVQNLRTGNYIEQPSSPANAVYLSTGKTPYAWSFSQNLH